METMEFLQKLINEGIAAIPEITGQNSAGQNSYNNWGYPGNTFDQGHTVAIAHRAPWQASGLVDTFELGYVPYPWGSNVSLDESMIGQSGAYLTLDDNYMGSAYDGTALVLTKGVENVGEPVEILEMVTELLEWDFCKKDYVAPEGSQDCDWLEEGIDEELHFFVTLRESVEFYNSINRVSFQLPWTRMIYENLDLPSTFAEYYEIDMRSMIEAGYATEEVMTPLQ